MTVVIPRGRLEAACHGLRQLGIDEVELGLHLPQSDQGQNRLGVLVRAQIGVGPQLVRRLEKTACEILQVYLH
ncbi:hypothetical protein D3C86_2181300 [compost metagenome]